MRKVVTVEGAKDPFLIGDLPADLVKFTMEDDAPDIVVIEQGESERICIEFSQLKRAWEAL